MNRRKADMQSTIGRLLGPAEAEVLCDECFERLDEYVELQIARLGADEQIPGMRAHLQGCPACHEEYDSLRELVQAGEPSPPLSRTGLP